MLVADQSRRATGPARAELRAGAQRADLQPGALDSTGWLIGTVHVLIAGSLVALLIDGLVVVDWLAGWLDVYSILPCRSHKLYRFQHSPRLAERAVPTYYANTSTHPPTPLSLWSVSGICIRFGLSTSCGMACRPRRPSWPRAGNRQPFSRSKRCYNTSFQ